MNPVTKEVRGELKIVRGSLAKYKEEYKNPLSTDFIYFNEVFCSAVGFLFFFLFYIFMELQNNKFTFLTVADPGFLRGGASTLQGATPYDFAKFPQKLHEIQRIWTGGRVPHAPLGSATVLRNSKTLNNLQRIW